MFIYKLSSTLSPQIYIGKTNDLNSRLKSHIWDKTDRRVTRWIAYLKKNNLLPIIQQIEEVENSIWPEREIYWIAYYRNLLGNEIILNMTDGGENPPINHRPRTEEVKKKISKKLKGVKKSKEHIENSRKARIGYKQTAEHIHNTSLANLSFTKEQVIEIRIKYESGNYTITRLAQEYGTTNTPIQNVIYRRRGYET